MLRQLISSFLSPPISPTSISQEGSVKRDQGPDETELERVKTKLQLTVPSLSYLPTQVDHLASLVKGQLNEWNHHAPAMDPGGEVPWLNGVEQRKGKARTHLTHLTSLPTGEEDGTYLALSVHASQLICAIVTLFGQGEIEARRMTHSLYPGAYGQDGRVVWECASLVERMLREAGDLMLSSLHLAVTWDIPSTNPPGDGDAYDCTNVPEATDINGDQGIPMDPRIHRAAGNAGYKVLLSLQNALDTRGLNVKVVAMVPPAVSLLMAQAYRNSSNLSKLPYAPVLAALDVGERRKKPCMAYLESTRRLWNEGIISGFHEAKDPSSSSFYPSGESNSSKASGGPEGYLQSPAPGTIRSNGIPSPARTGYMIITVEVDTDDDREDEACMGQGTGEGDIGELCSQILGELTLSGDLLCRRLPFPQVPHLSRGDIIAIAMDRTECMEGIRGVLQRRFNLESGTSISTQDLLVVKEACTVSAYRVARSLALRISLIVQLLEEGGQIQLDPFPSHYSISSSHSSLSDAQDSSLYLTSRGRPPYPGYTTYEDQSTHLTYSFAQKEDFEERGRRRSSRGRLDPSREGIQREEQGWRPIRSGWYGSSAATSAISLVSTTSSAVEARVMDALSTESLSQALTMPSQTILTQLSHMETFHTAGSTFNLSHKDMREEEGEEGEEEEEGEGEGKEEGDGEISHVLSQELMTQLDREDEERREHEEGRKDGKRPSEEEVGDQGRESSSSFPGWKGDDRSEILEEEELGLDEAEESIMDEEPPFTLDPRGDGEEEMEGLSQSSLLVDMESFDGNVLHEDEVGRKAKGSMTKKPPPLLLTPLHPRYEGEGEGTDPSRAIFPLGPSSAELTPSAVGGEEELEPFESLTISVGGLLLASYPNMSGMLREGMRGALGSTKARSIRVEECGGVDGCVGAAIVVMLCVTSPTDA